MSAVSPKEIEEALKRADEISNVSNKLLDFIVESNDVWDINYIDVRDWIMFNRDKLIEIIK